MLNGAKVSIIIGCLGIIAGIANRQGGNIPESMDILSYFIGLLGIIVAAILFYISAIQEPVKKEVKKPAVKVAKKKAVSATKKTVKKTTKKTTKKKAA